MSRDSQLGLSTTEHRPRFVKIVRSRIAQFLGTSEVIYRPAEPQEVVDGLRRKLIEEAVEYLLDPCLGELADVWEVVRALAIHDLRVKPDAVSAYAQDKADERGDFLEGFGMYVTTNAPHEFEGNGR